MKKLIMMGLVVVGVSVSQLVYAQGTTYLSSLGQPPTGSGMVGGETPVGPIFTWQAAQFYTGNNVGGYTLDSIQVAMADASGIPSGFTAMLYNNGGSISPRPGNSLGVLNGSDNPSTAGTYIYTPGADIILSPDTYYSIVLSANTGPGSIGAYEWNMVAGASSYSSSGGWEVASPSSFYSSNDSDWIPGSSCFQYAIIATAIPEPSASWLLLLGSGILFYVRRNREHFSI
jgi:PEP-CTERM motif